MKKGQNYNRLTVVEFLNRREVRCKCECGRFHVAQKYDILNGKVKSCGCLRREGLHFKHGAKKNGKVVSKEYYSWQAMRSRCLNPNNKRYKDYGGRGITICEEWNDFCNFIEDMGYKPSSNHTIERLDVNKGYSPENCVWADHTTQNRNKRKAKNNTSGVTGVGWNKRANKWRARISVNGKTILIGSFDNKEDAIEARINGELKYWKTKPS